MHAAIQSGDAATVKAEAHALKGGIGTFFATASFETAYKLEIMGAAGDLKDAKATLQTLETELTSLRKKLEELMA